MKTGLKVCFWGGTGEVGASCFSVESGRARVLLDAGFKVTPEGPEYPAIPKRLVRQVDAVVLSHAHIDHCGYLPFLVRQGFSGPIYANAPTKELVRILLEDAVKIAGHNKVRGFYTLRDVAQTLSRFRAVSYGKRFSVAPGLYARMAPSGHILGSSQVLLDDGKKKLLYSSDFNARQSTLLPAARPLRGADALIIESTYGLEGDKLPPLKTASRAIADAINETFLLGGTVLVPVFAMGRGQELLLAIENYVRSGYLPEDTVVFVDGMVQKANKVCETHVDFLRPQIARRVKHGRDNPFHNPIIRAPKTRSKRDVYETPNAVVLATSGMLTGGPSVSYLQKLAPNPRNLVCLVGFQAPGSVGRQLLEGAKSVKVDKKTVRVRAPVRSFRFSGHADFDGLLRFAKASSARRAFVVHGEGEKSRAFARMLKKKAGMSALVPEKGGCYVV